LTSRTTLLVWGGDGLAGAGQVAFTGDRERPEEHGGVVGPAWRSRRMYVTRLPDPRFMIRTSLVRELNVSPPGVGPLSQATAETLPLDTGGSRPATR
jgi:hypothetical protein